VYIFSKALGIVASHAWSFVTPFSQHEMRCVMRCSDATSTSLQSISDEKLVPRSALSRSALLAEIHQVDPEGCVHVPCDSKTWTAWLTDRPSQMTSSEMELMLDVMRVRFSYTLECLQVLDGSPHRPRTLVS
jgi:hypothetical protein